jgi:hypothetical protein
LKVLNLQKDAEPTGEATTDTITDTDESKGEEPAADDDKTE